MIRRALLSDSHRAVELLRDSRVGAGFNSADGVSGFVFPFDPIYAERMFLRYLAGGPLLALVHDVDGVAQGILLAHSFEHEFGPVWLAQERVWWIDPAHRGGTAAVKMLTAYHDWARSKGCKFAGMGGMGADPAVGGLYERCGYQPAETHFLKPL
jgi:GNAT superfamily N-acetyltransferase